MTGKTQTSALIVIDVQWGLFTRATPMYKGDEVLANINALVDKAREEGVPVIYIQHENASTLILDSPEWQLHPEIKPRPDDLRIYKKQGNAFLDTPLKEELDKLGVNRMVVTGLVTQGCVRATTRGALELGYQVILANDAHSTYSRGASEIVRERNKELGNAGAVVIPSAEVSF